MSKPEDQNQDPAKAAAEEALRIAKELEEKLNKDDEGKPKGDQVPTRDEISKVTGITKEGIDFIVNAAGAASADSNARSARAEVKEKHKDFDRFQKQIDVELAKYPVEKRGNVDLVEKIYYMEKGKDADKGGSGNGQPVIRSSGNPTDSGLENGGGDNNAEGALNKEELYVARRMNISPADYAKSKGTKLIYELK